MGTEPADPLSATWINPAASSTTTEREQEGSSKKIRMGWAFLAVEVKEDERDGEERERDEQADHAPPSSTKTHDDLEVL